MKALKSRWEIEKNWQLLFPFLGSIAVLFSGYAIAKAILNKFTSNNILLVFLTIFISYGILNVTLRLFKPLASKWKVTYRWELIAIFLVFAVTGSSAAKLSGPLLELIHLKELITNAALFWTIRILIIFPIYQLLLVVFGWCFGQFTFFWDFEKKMLKRLGFKRFFKD